MLALARGPRLPLGPPKQLDPDAAVARVDEGRPGQPPLVVAELREAEVPRIPRLAPAVHRRFCFDEEGGVTAVLDFELRP